MQAKRTKRNPGDFSTARDRRATLPGLRSLGYEYWRDQPAIDSGHFDNLVYDDGHHRVWVSRMSLADYGGNRSAWLAERLTFEKRVNGRWVKE